MLCYILAQYAPQVHENILLFFRHKKQSHRNCCRILNINLVIGICKSNSSKLQMLPTPTRHLQIQFQQVADASDPRICICKSNSSKLQMLPNPGYASTNPIPASCRCFRTQDMHLQIQFQQIADASNPGQASANPIPTNCRCFQLQPGICKSNSSKLQMLPTPTRHLQIQFQQIADASDPRICICKFISNKLQMLPTPTRHLQIQFQQIADASNPNQASANPIPASCRCFRPRPGIYKSNSSKLQMLPTPARHLQIQFQQVADASDPDQASVAPKTTNQRCPPVNFFLKFAGGHLYCISISSNSYICLFLIHRGLSRPASWHLYGTFPFFHKFPYVLLWKSLPTRQLLLLSVPDGFCPR